jgi:hypothetical protein
MSASIIPAAVPTKSIADRRSRREVLFLREEQLSRILYGSIAFGLLLLPAYYDTSLWLGVGVAVTMFVAWHALAVGARVPWIPGLMAIAACLQWVVTPWVTYLIDAQTGARTMAAPAADYFRFAVPSTLTYVLGLYLPSLLSRRLPRAYDYRVKHAPRRLLALCDTMIIGGTVVRVVVLPFVPFSLRFAVAMIGYLALVGALGVTLLRPRGWYWRVLLAMGPVVLLGLRETVFLETLLWGLLIATFSAYRMRLRPGLLIAMGVAGVMVMLAVNAGKRDFRLEMVEGVDDPRDVASGIGTTVVDYLATPSVLFSWDNISYSVLRLNEGWITSRLLVWTPSMEPFAGGETVANAVRSSLVPRILDKDKLSAGGRDNVPRFAGITLIQATSMNLSVPGEMYANWGLTGAWIGSFFVALMLGAIFVVFATRARRSPLWFAWAPYVLIGAISPEMGLPEILNSVSKSAVIMFAIIYVLPPWRRALWPRRPRAAGIARPH